MNAMNDFARILGDTTVNSDDPCTAKALNLVTYVCAYGFWDQQDYIGNADSWPKPKKTKSGWRIFPPDKPKIRLLGSDFGERIGQERSKGFLGGTKRPHLRRPHWHHFWKGPKENRSLIARWLPPIFVGNIEPKSEI